MKRIYLVFILIVVTIVALLFMLSRSVEKEKSSNSSNQLANPAAQYCAQNHGTSQVRKDAEGNEYGVCVFSDGSECDEWAYFRGECKAGNNE